MFETVELGSKLSRSDYEEAVPGLRSRLLAAQLALRGTRTPVLVVIAGAESSGKGDTVNRLHEWLDPRGLETHVFGPLSDEEKDRPPFWRVWRALPARGRIGLFFGSWYTDPIVRRISGTLKTGRFEAELARIAFFEEMLVRDGALLLKFWFHLSKGALKTRLKRLEKDPATRWKVTSQDWQRLKTYDRFVEVSERALRKTDSGAAPWTLVEALDDRHRDLTVGAALAGALEGSIGGKPAARSTERPSVRAEGGASPVLDSVDLSQTVPDKEYRKRLARLQGELHRLGWAAAQKKVSTVVVFEGSDAAGKGGAIRRLTWALDARLYRVIAIAAPTDEERAHHYLWRFWRHLPRSGQITIFDRSWYGRVLVERVERFATEDEWRRAYLEINDFEQQLVEARTVVAKFWLQITAEEQLRRFGERQETAYKQHKITDEDWRNREKWDAYRGAVEEMVERTSTHDAPWTLVAANDKKVARLEVLSTLVRRLGRAL